mgnify:CR=1 FL=1
MLSSNLFAQKLDFKWSQNVRFDNKNAGLFESVSGGNSKFTYILNKSYKDGYSSADFYLHAINNDNGKLSSSAILRNNKNKDAKGMHLKGVYVQEEVIYVFWINDVKSQEEIHVQSFDQNLKVIGKLKKIQQYPKSKERKTREPVIFILSNEKQRGNILLGAELSLKEGESVKVEAKILKSDLSFEGLVKVELPITAKPSNRRLTSDYIFGDDGNLHIKTRIKEDKGKNLTDYFDLYTYANVETGNSFHYPFKFEGKQIFDFKILEKDGKVSFVGMFMNIEQQKKVRTMKLNGLFQANLDIENKTLANVNFEQFDTDFLRDLFKNDTKDLKKDKKTGNSDEINNDYVIEEYRIADNGEITLFTTIMNNYSITICPPKGACYTNYYCLKSNVTVFRFDKEGNLIWGKNIDRTYEYSGWYISDVNVIEDESNYYITYGTKPDIKKHFAPEKAKQFKRSDVLEYAIMDKDNGTFKTTLYEINRPGIARAEKKDFGATDISVLSNRMYAVNNDLKRTGGGKVIRCMTMICFPIGVLTNFGDFGAYKYTILQLGTSSIK